MSRGLTAFVIATACVTALMVIGAPWLRLESKSGQTHHATDDPRLAKGRQFFEMFVRLDQARDLAILDLYSESAVVIDRRPAPNGQPSDLKIPFAAFRPMLKGLYVVAKAAEDPPSTYSEIKEFLDGDGVRIESDSYSQSEEFQRHLSMLIRPFEGDTWRIEELIVESPEVR